MTAAVVYSHELLCGHRHWFSEMASTGISWCSACGRYVGVVVRRVEGRS